MYKNEYTALNTIKLTHIKNYSNDLLNEFASLFDKEKCGWKVKHYKFSADGEDALNIYRTQ